MKDYTAWAAPNVITVCGGEQGQRHKQGDEIRYFNFSCRHEDDYINREMAVS
jgi:hypothetical protein